MILDSPVEYDGIPLVFHWRIWFPLKVLR